MAGGFDERSSNSRERFGYQVFLSFRGEDVRKSFISHLHHALKQRGIITFYDDSGLPRGDDIQLKLYEAIETSELSVITFSPRYATSRWCLDELVRIMECKESHGHIVLPVFYGVDPTHFRNQSGPYQEAFNAHETRFKDESHRVTKWRNTLRSTADLAGLCLQNKANGYEALLVEHIITEVVKKLDARQLNIPMHVVGVESLVEKISSWLRNGSSETEVGVIYGPGGVGKTTVAKIVYNGHRHRFKSSSFLAGVRSASQNSESYIHLQEQLVLHISGNEATKIYNIHEGKEMIRHAIGTKKILVVLDDVDDSKQLHDMFECPEWFFPGCKILITTRNQHLSNATGAFTVPFQVCALNVEKSTLLFCHHAFNQSYPLQDYLKITKLLLKYCDGLPLALKVLASSLRGKSLETWELQYVKLRDFPNPKVHDVLKLSFDSLDDSNDKETFLHIAFFMVGMKKDYALTILDGCRLHGIIGLENLIDKCLLSVSRDTLVMHNLIQNMAYEVVRQEEPFELGRRSRLLGQKAREVLRKKMGTSAVRGLHLDFRSSTDNTSSEETYIKKTIHSPATLQHCHESKLIKTGAFKKMCDLDLLLLENVQLEGDFEKFPSMIKWICWRGFPLKSIPLDFDLEELVVLDMQASCLVNAWKGTRDMGALKILDLSYSYFLVCTPDLSGARKLEGLFLRGCVGLMDIHESIGNLRNLKHLNFEGCISLVRLHNSVGNLENLSILNLKGCKSLVSLAIPTSVVELNLSECSNLFTDGKLMELSALSLSTSDTVHFPSASSLPQYPVVSTYPCSQFIFNLPFLTNLKLIACGISRDDVFELLSCAPSLVLLNLRDNPIRVLSSKDKHSFLKLSHLSVRYCTKLQSISQLSRGCMVIADGCSSLKGISYVNHPGPIVHPIYATRCEELVEVDYGCNDRVALKLTDDMYEGRDNQLGFPNLHNFVFGSILENSEDGLMGIKRGLYRAGTYQAYHLGDQLATWFSTISTESELHYTVPSTQNHPGIQTMNLGFVGSGDNRDFCIYYVKVKNLTRMWEWTLHTPSGAWLDSGSCEVTLTWLSHWCIMEHREINPGDTLHISLSTYGCFWIEKWGIQIIYDDGIVDENSIKENDDYHVRKIGDPWSGSSEGPTVNLISKATPPKVNGPVRPHSIDLSMYESKHKPREYHVPCHINIPPNVIIV